MVAATQQRLTIETFRHGHYMLTTWRGQKYSAQGYLVRSVAGGVEIDRLTDDCRGIVETYTVGIRGGKAVSCNCKDFHFRKRSVRGGTCKHTILADHHNANEF